LLLDTILVERVGGRYNLLGGERYKLLGGERYKLLGGERYNLLLGGERYNLLWWKEIQLVVLVRYNFGGESWRDIQFAWWRDTIGCW
jgi:hypothetical protein